MCEGIENGTDTHANLPQVLSAAEDPGDGVYHRAPEHRTGHAGAYGGEGDLEYAVQPDDMMRIVQGR